MVDTSPEIPKSVTSIIEMFERSSSVESDSVPMKEIKAKPVESKSDLKTDSPSKTIVKTVDSDVDDDKPPGTEIKTTEPDEIKQDSDLVTDTDVDDALSPRTHVKQIVEDIEAKVEHITQQVVEDTTWQELAINELDTKTVEIETKDTTTFEDTTPLKQTDSACSSSETKVDSDVSMSVKELVKRHESIVKEQSIEDKTEAPDISSQTEIKALIPSKEIILKDEPVLMVIETIDDLISEEHELRAQSEVVHPKVDLKELDSVKTFNDSYLQYEATDEWENVDALEFDEPCKLPSPIEQHYPEYKIEKAEVAEQDSASCLKHDKMVRPDEMKIESDRKIADGSKYFMDIIEDTEPKFVDENELKDFKKEFEEVRIKKEVSKEADADLVDSFLDKNDVDSKKLQTVKLEKSFEPQTECTEISKLNIDSENNIEISPSKNVAAKDSEAQMVVREFSPEHIEQCDDTYNASVEQVQKQDTSKETEYLVTEELDVAEFKEEIVSETAQEEICTAIQIDPDENLQNITMVSEEVLLPKPVESVASAALPDTSDESEKDYIENDYLSDDISSKKYEKNEKEIQSNVSETVPLNDENIVVKKSKLNETAQGSAEADELNANVCIPAIQMSSKSDPIVPAIPGSSLEYAECPDDQFQEVFEEKTELEKEHDSYFLEDSRYMTNMKKERILLSRQESNIEITLAEYNEPFENEYDIEMHADQYVDHYDSENEYYDREDLDDDDYKCEDMVETESQTEHSILRTLQELENKEKDTQEKDKPQENESSKTLTGEISTGISVLDSFEAKEKLTSLTEQVEPDLSEPNEAEVVESSESKLVKSEEPSVEQTLIDEEQPMAEMGLHGRVYSDIMEVASEEMEGEPVGFSVHIEEDEDYPPESEGRRKASFRLDSVDEENPDDIPMDQVEDEDIEDTAKVIEIIEGDEDEEIISTIQSDIEGPISACPSERVEFDYVDMNETTSDYDLALHYVEKEDKTIKLDDGSNPLSDNECDIDGKMEQRQTIAPTSESREDIFQMDDIIQEEELEDETKSEGVSEKVLMSADQFRSDLSPPILDRTEEFIELSYDAIDIQVSKGGNVTIKSKDDSMSPTVKDSSKLPQTGEQHSDLDHGSVPKDYQEMDDIESDSIEDSEVDSLLENRQLKKLEPEQESVKSSERPLSPTDYTLDIDMDESFIAEKKASPETEGQMYTDVSQQIFIEQSIEGTRFSPLKVKRVPGDGKEFNEDVPPSPSEYTLVASYDQEMLKKALQQSPERVHHTPEKKPHQFSNLIYEDSMSVSMDESVLQRSLGLTADRNIMSASYDEEALKRVYDEEDIMVSSTEHAMQDSLIASSLEPDEYRYTGSVCSGRDEDFSEVSDHGGMEKSYEADMMTDSYDRDSLHRSGGSEQVSLADSVEQDTVESAIEINKLTEQDLMTSSMDPEALQYSLGLHPGMMSSMDQDVLRESLGLDKERDVMKDSLDQGLSQKSEDVMGSSDELKKSLGLGDQNVMDSSDELKKSLGLSDQDLMGSSDELKKSLGLGDQDIMSGIMDIDSLHRSLGLASSDSQMETSMESEAMQKSLGLDKVQSEVMYDSVEEEALKASLREDLVDQENNNNFDIMTTSMDQESLELSLGMERQEDVMMISMDQDVLRASLGLETIEECRVYDEQDDKKVDGTVGPTDIVDEHDAEDLHAKGTFS